jgi:N6-adenosine-specific RNA methylase IME4
MKARVIVADPPWPFGDKLTMSDVKRGSESNYKTMTMDDIKKLDVESIAADDAVLALWVPGAMVADGTGTEVLEAWGFKGKQVHVWVKTKKGPVLKTMAPRIEQLIKDIEEISPKKAVKQALRSVTPRDLNDTLAFGMGRLWRQAHEICIIGTRGKPYKYLKDKSQRSVHFGPVMKHSAKPEDMQDMIDKMFPRVKKIELFARRDRDKWTCVGLECPSSIGEDIRDSIERIKNL